MRPYNNWARCYAAICRITEHARRLPVIVRYWPILLSRECPFLPVRSGPSLDGLGPSGNTLAEWVRAGGLMFCDRP
jgi:hypothetical protein